MHNNKKNSKSRTPSVEETNARLDKEFADQGKQKEESPPKEGEFKSFDEPMPTSSVLADESEELAPDISAFGSDRPLRETSGSLLPNDSEETNQSAKDFFAKITRDSDKRNQNPPLLLDDLRELGMYGELSEDQRHITMPFEDVHRLVTFEWTYSK